MSTEQPTTLPAGGAAEPPIVTIVGTLVTLGPLRRALRPLYQRWINDQPAHRQHGPARH